SKQIALRFVRTAVLDGWKAVNLLVVGSGLPGFAIDSHGYAEQLSQAKLSQLLILPERAPRMFIAFLSSSGSAGGFAAGPNTIGVIQADHHLVVDAARRYVASSVSYEPADRPVLVYPLVDGGALVAFVIAKHIRHVGACGCWIAAYPAGDAPLWPGPFTYSEHYEVAGLAVIPSKHASTAGTVAMVGYQLTGTGADPE